jgi:hypothetical protein
LPMALQRDMGCIISRRKWKLMGAVLEAQFGCHSFHAKRYKGSGAKLTITVKNKWAAGWTRVWFYCNVSLL